jgi:GNAT superfamily N-acetyltransferase
MDLLDVYDAQARMPSPGADDGMIHEYDGRMVRIVGGHVGRIRGPRDVGVTGAALDRLILRQRDYFRDRGQGVDWKVCAHDLPADLPERLVAAGFVPEEPASVLVGVSTAVAAAGGPAGPPGGIAVRQVSDDADLRRIADHQTKIWGYDLSWVAGHLGAMVAADPAQITIWVAEADGHVVSAAWSMYDPGTAFAALLGGTTLPQWRRRGIYRALITARAREAADRGVTYLQVDASPDSAPILRRCGFTEITTSRHFHWTPPS